MTELPALPPSALLVTDWEELEALVLGGLEEPRVQELRALAQEHEWIRDAIAQMETRVRWRTEWFGRMVQAIADGTPAEIVAAIIEGGEDAYQASWIERILDHREDAAKVLGRIVSSARVPVAARRDAGAALVAIQLRRVQHEIGTDPIQAWKKTLTILKPDAAWATSKRNLTGPTPIERVGLFLDRIAANDPLLPDPPLSLSFARTRGHLLVEDLGGRRLAKAVEDARKSMAVLQDQWLPAGRLDTTKPKRVSSSSGRGS